MFKILTICAICWYATNAYAIDYPPPGSHVTVTRSQLAQYTKLQIAKAIAYAKANKITWNIIEDAQANTMVVQK